MTETRKLAAILCSDVVGYSRLAGADEDRILARLRALRRDLIDPTIAVHRGRIVKRTGDGSIIEFRSVVDAVRCAIEVQNAMVERNAGVPEDRRIVFRIGIHLGDVVEESDGDLMGDGVNFAARLEGVAAPGAICLSEDAYRQVKGRLDLAVTDLGPTQLKNIAEPIRAYSLEVGKPAQAKPASITKPPEPKEALGARVARSCVCGSALRPCVGYLVFPVRKPIDDRRDERAGACPDEYSRAGEGRALFACRAAVRQPLERPEPGLLRRWHNREPDHRDVAHSRQFRDRPQYGFCVQGEGHRRQGDRQRTRRAIRA
jgi:class 3 adenylate cyclase